MLFFQVLHRADWLPEVDFYLQVPPHRNYLGTDCRIEIDDRLLGITVLKITQAIIYKWQTAYASYPSVVYKR